MGVNNRQRRAAKQRQRARQTNARQGTQQSGSQQSGSQRSWTQQAETQRPEARPDPRPEAAPPTFDHQAVYAEAHHQLVTRVHMLAHAAPTQQEALAQVQLARRRVPRASVLVFAEVLTAYLADLRAQLQAGGWPPRDRHELVARCDRSLVPLLRQVEAGGVLGLDDEDALASGLRLAARLRAAPPLQARPAVTAPADDAPEHPKLRQVRALLAKAESTDSEEEAEALTAKAQELVSRHSLADLLAAARAAGAGPGAGVGAGLTVRRIWLDAPYVPGKATLVDQVARANRCRVVLEGRFDFCLLVGQSADVTAVELLVTSLLLQGGSAMLRPRPSVGSPRGSTARGGGTRAFRHAFWLAFAVRVGQRLHEADLAATATMAADGGGPAPARPAGDLLPALRAHEEHVEAAFELWVGRTRQRTVSVSSGAGWAAGTAAADLAHLGGGAQLDRDRTGSR